MIKDMNRKKKLELSVPVKRKKKYLKENISKLVLETSDQGFQKWLLSSFILKKKQQYKYINDLRATNITENWSSSIVQSMYT